MGGHSLLQYLAIVNSNGKYIIFYMQTILTIFGIFAGAIAVLTLVFKIGDWKGHVDSDREAFKKFIEEIRNDIKKILERLPASTTSGSSPLQLTELGKSISEELKAFDWAKQIAPELIRRVKGKHPYEIQEFCLDYVTREAVTEDMSKEIQTCAYENGVEKEEVLKVLAVELRDELLEKLKTTQD